MSVFCSFPFFLSVHNLNANLNAIRLSIVFMPASSVTLLASPFTACRNTILGTRHLEQQAFYWFRAAVFPVTCIRNTKTAFSINWNFWENLQPLTNSVQQSPFWQANNTSNIQEICCIFGTRKFTAVLFTTSHWFLFRGNRISERLNLPFWDTF